ncbi:pep a2 [Streptomyces sp. NPDC006422]|uniref:pep a2 n=1 Tax=unclassified Streptomyces TaxID=2593676 RepID=UPI0033AA3F74
MHQATPSYYHIAVDPIPERVGQVQRIVAAHTRYWGLETLTPSVTRGLGLLLELAVRGRPDARIEVEAWWNGQHLISAVSYEDAATGTSQELSRRCSTQLAAMSDGWGSCTQDARHIVWFSLRSTIGDREVRVPMCPVPDASEALQVPRTTLPHAAPEPATVAAPEPEPATVDTAAAS